MPILGLAATGTDVYVADGSAGLHIVDVSNAASPTDIGSFASITNAVAVATIGPDAYVADGGGNLYVIDVSDPYHPFQASIVPLAGTPAAIATLGQYVLVGGSAGLQIVNATSPTSPSVVTTDSQLLNIISLTTAGTDAYEVIDPSGDLWRVDLSQLSQPSITGYWIAAYPEASAAVGTTVYMTLFYTGVIALDASAPTDISNLATSYLPSDSYGVASLGNNAYVANGDGGLYIVAYSATTPKAFLPIVGSATLPPG
jgi:hypothetical protein